MPRGRIPRHYTNMFKVRTVDDWREARARGDTCAEFARSRGIPHPNLQNCHGAHVGRDGPEKPGSEAVLVPALHASESSDHPTNLPFWAPESGRVGRATAPLRGASDGGSK
ncbi:hypothetical protein JG687_00019329 [Phytophthora cactorum]|uniref:Uncharacterized protein n=1 Tax=Phytophthora cactorum TaxID=29920 RepID=A0A8T1TKT1_9STRA|nr:hypothetical protein GQ600_5337 [Phytophthora cactorum]KAG6941983.1 hypothetical protein JG687_00019329 [Phytophthora cactorum]